MIIDCDRCEVRGLACDDCVVTVLLGAPPHGAELDPAEQTALGVLAEAGMVPPLRLVLDDGTDGRGARGGNTDDRGVTGGSESGHGRAAGAG